MGNIKNRRHPIGALLLLLDDSGEVTLW